MANLPNIEYTKIKKNPTIESPTSAFELPFYKDEEYLSVIDNFVQFVKAVERLVRLSDDYKRYKSYLMGEIGLTYCQVLSNIEEEFANIEMHHGPVFTLFDYACILTDWMLAKNKKITTFNVAELLLEEHFKHRIQVVMLSETIHEQVHAGNIFINLNQAFGDLNGFVEKYRDGFNLVMAKKLNYYIQRSITSGASFDNGVLQLNAFVSSWKQNYDFEENKED